MAHQTATVKDSHAVARYGTVPQQTTLLERYEQVRRFGQQLCQPLETEDYVIQSMPDVSPTRWHLAHTTWFFETFVLVEKLPGYQAFHPDFVYLFNSYYNAVGEPFPRPRRGLLSRPTVKEVFAYRAHVDRHMRELLTSGQHAEPADLAPLIEIGLHHEHQHQELMLTDIKHVFSCNPLYPVYTVQEAAPSRAVAPLSWIGFEEGTRWIGHDGQGFSYDNEAPRHRTLVHAFELANRLITNAEYLEFMEDGGYDRPELWLSDGWATIKQRGWDAPLYWIKRDDGWWYYTLSGMRPVNPAEPVCHVSYFEADAFARWAGAALPTEAAWETASAMVQVKGNFAEDGSFQPRPCCGGNGATGPAQMFGDVWEWTSSPYVGYPGYRPPEGAIGEYNGKFMCNQIVLRGGSCATPRAHIRRTYRNFFPPDARWQFAGIRLAK